MFIHGVAVEALAWPLLKAGSMLLGHPETTLSPPLGALGVLCLLLVWASACHLEDRRAGGGGPGSAPHTRGRPGSSSSLLNPGSQADSTAPRDTPGGPLISPCLGGYSMRPYPAGSRGGGCHPLWLSQFRNKNHNTNQQPPPPHLACVC